MATAAIYIRVSSEEQALRGYSLADQLESCTQYAQKLGCSDPVVIEDPGVTASVLERPGIQRLLELVGVVDYIICKDPDRFARNLAHQLLITDQIERGGHTKLRFVDFERSDSPEGRLFYAMRGAVSEFEKAKITQRMMAGRWRKAREGGIPVRIHAFGYTQQDGELFIEPTQAAVVRQIYDWFVNGMDEHDPPVSFHAISKRLERMGVRGSRGGLISASGVRNMLLSKTYNGTLYVRRYDTEGMVANPYLPYEERIRQVERPRDEWISVPVPAIIGDRTWDEAQRMHQILRRIRPKRRRMRVYLLTGIATCARCGGAMVGTSVGRGKGRRSVYYACRRRNHGGGDACDMEYARAEDVESAVWRTVVEWIRTPDLLIEALSLDTTEGTVDPEESRLGLQRIKQERGRLLRLYQSGLVPEDEIEGQLRELKGREDLLQARLAQAKSKPDVDAAAVKEFAGSLQLRLDKNVQDDDRQQIIRAVVEQVYFDGKERGKHVIRVMPRFPQA